MRAKKSPKKLVLHKQTLANLDHGELQEVKGGSLIRCITEVIQCLTDTCQCTAMIAGCSTSVPGYC